MSSIVKAVPNFFVVGAPKAGSTSLYHYLDQHPEVYMSPIKEPNYFSSEVRPENLSEELQERSRNDLQALKEYLRGPMSEKRFGGMVLEWEDYLRLFQNVKGEKAIGEASVCYLWSKTAPRSIASIIPNARIIMILRDPADRAFSQYLHTVANGVVCESFRRHIQRSLRWKSEKFGLRNPFLELGLYYEQVKQYLDLFPRRNVSVLLFEDYQRRPAETLAGIFRFVNVDASFAPDTSQKQLEPRVPRSIPIAHFLKRYGIWQRMKGPTPLAFRSHLRRIAFRKRESLVMDERDRQYLLDYYRDDIKKLSNLLDCDLSGWLN
jgi:hypothetical protein